MTNNRINSFAYRFLRIIKATQPGMKINTTKVNHIDQIFTNPPGFHSFKDLGDKLDAALKSDIEGKIASLKTLMEGEDVEAIKKATEELAQASHKLAEQLYSQAQGQQPGAEGAAGAAGAQPGAGAAGGKKADDDVIDADFTESK